MTNNCKNISFPHGTIRTGRTNKIVLPILALLILAVPSLLAQSDPTDLEQYMLELTNRARANGNAEALREGQIPSVNEGPPDILGEIWTILNTAQPLAWNALLKNSALGQANLLQNDDQFFINPPCGFPAR